MLLYYIFITYVQKICLNIVIFLKLVNEIYVCYGIRTLTKKGIASYMVGALVTTANMTLMRNFLETITKSKKHYYDANSSESRTHDLLGTYLTLPKFIFLHLFV